MLDDDAKNARDVNADIATVSWFPWKRNIHREVDVQEIYRNYQQKINIIAIKQKIKKKLFW